MSLELSGTTGVKGVAGSVSAPSIVGDDTNTGISFPAADTIKFSTGGVERMSITNSGVSGIDTGGMTLLSTTSLSSSGSVSANVSLNLTGYRYLYGQLYGIARSGGGGLGDTRLNFNGDSSTIHQYVMQRMDNSGAYSNIGVQDATGFYVNQTGVSGFDSVQNYAHFTLHLLNEGTRKTFEMTHCYQSSGGEGVLTTNGFINASAAITSLAVEHSNNDISAGTLKLYGVK